MSIATNLKHIIYLHGWDHDEEGNQTYSDSVTPEGWCVYVAQRRGNQDTLLDHFEEKDFPTEEEARAFAKELAEKYDGEIREY